MRLCSDALNNRCELGTGGVAGRCEYLARVALDEAGLGAVSDAVYCPRGDLRAVNESGNLVLVCRYIHAGQLALTGEQGRDLFAGYAAVGLELVVANALHDAGLGRPRDGGACLMGHGNVGEGRQFNLGLTCQIVQGGSDLCTGQSLVCAEYIRLLAAHQMLVGDVLGSVIVPCVLGNVGVIGDLLAGLEVVEDLVAVDSLEAVPVVRVLLLVSGALDGILGEFDDGEYLLILFVYIEVGGVIRTCRNVLIELVADRAAGEVGGAVAGVDLDVVLDGGADVGCLFTFELFIFLVSTASFLFMQLIKSPPFSINSLVEIFLPHFEQFSISSITLSPFLFFYIITQGLIFVYIFVYLF